jgi:hypothetical protein
MVLAIRFNEVVMPTTNPFESTPVPVTDRTIHNEVNFRPEEYEVLDYLDNQPPRWQDFCPPVMFGAPTGVYETAIASARQAYEGARGHWNREMDKYFPARAQGQPSIHKCTHCGNTQVRYIIAVRHIPTNQNVVFGDVCVERLGFVNYEAFKAAQIRAKAAQGNASLAVFRKREQFLADHPDFAVIINNPTELSHPDHARNGFAIDIILKFNKYGKLSDAQFAAFIQSIARDHEYAARRAQEAAQPRGPVPTGRVIVEGELIKVKTYDPEVDGRSGTKMTLKLDNGSKVWMTMPIAYDLQTHPKGSRVKVRATITASRDDVSFGFGKRPTLISATAPVVPISTADSVQ